MHKTVEFSKLLEACGDSNGTSGKQGQSEHLKERFAEVMDRQITEYINDACKI